MKDLSEQINQKIQEINTDVLSGKISLLEHELVPIFDELANTLTTSNIFNYSDSYKQACELLNKKFEELKQLLNSLNSEEKFFDFLKDVPSDNEISALFDGCWIKPFEVKTLSIRFLEECKDKLCTERNITKFIYDPPEKIKTDEEFTVQIPMRDFNDKMLSYFKLIKKNFPCSLEDIFENETDQSEIFQNFVYLLHLFQLGKIQYQKETNFLYTEED